MVGGGGGGGAPPRRRAPPAPPPPPRGEGDEGGARLVDDPHARRGVVGQQGERVDAVDDARMDDHQIPVGEGEH
ncbi:hypothetical protein, partial [Nocardia farcinica]|uniref:hypothetical protein n=1 Tax=Nocardia farcinica TaxID=37329 RepID=UPI002454D0D2